MEMMYIADVYIIKMSIIMYYNKHMYYKTY